MEPPRAKVFFGPEKNGTFTAVTYKVGLESPGLGILVTRSGPNSGGCNELVGDDHMFMSYMPGPCSDTRVTHAGLYFMWVHLSLRSCVGNPGRGSMAVEV